MYGFLCKLNEVMSYSWNWLTLTITEKLAKKINTIYCGSTVFAYLFVTCFYEYTTILNSWSQSNYKPVSVSLSIVSSRHLDQWQYRNINNVSDICLKLTICSAPLIQYASRFDGLPWGWVISDGEAGVPWTSMDDSMDVQGTQISFRLAIPKFEGIPSH